MAKQTGYLKNIPSVRSKIFVHEILSDTKLRINKDIKEGFKLKPKKLNWFTKPKLSYRDIVIILIIVRLVWFLIDHIDIHIGWN